MDEEATDFELCVMGWQRVLQVARLPSNKEDKSKEKERVIGSLLSPFVLLACWYIWTPLPILADSRRSVDLALTYPLVLRHESRG